MSRLKDYLKEITVVKPEQMNWKKINPKLDVAIRNVVDAGKLITKGSKQHKGLHSILNSLKAIQADLRHMSVSEEDVYWQGGPGDDPKKHKPVTATDNMPIFIKRYPSSLKYDEKLFTKTLKKAGAKKIWTEKQYGYGKPVVLFAGITDVKAANALRKLPAFKEFGAALVQKTVEWSKAKRKKEIPYH